MKSFLQILANLFLITSTNTFAQEIEWQKTIGGLMYDNLTSIQQTLDGGYIAAGGSRSNISGDKTENSQGNADYWIIKLDSTGNIQWQNTIGGALEDMLHCIKQTPDGGYICGGTSDSYISGDKIHANKGDFDCWILKLDTGGNIIWQKTIGGNASDVLYSIEPTSDGGYICGASSSSGISWDKTEINYGWEDYWIFKLDATGTIIWQNTINGDSDDILKTIHQTPDNGFIISGHSSSGVSSDKSEAGAGYDFWIIKLNALGNILWEKTLGGNNHEGQPDIQITLDGGLICAGTTRSDISGDVTEISRGFEDFWIIKLDGAGNTQWQKRIGGNYSEWALSCFQNPDGSFIIGGETGSLMSGDKTENNYGIRDGYLLQLDSIGEIVWQNTIGGMSYDNIISVGMCKDGGVIVGSMSRSEISEDKADSSRGDFDFWVYKIANKYNSIQGDVFTDLNSDNLINGNDVLLQGVKFSESISNRISFSNSQGKLNFTVVDTGQFFIEPDLISPFYNSNPSVHNAYFSSINQIDSLNDFAFQPIGSYNDLCLTITPLGAFRPGFNANYMLNYENVGTTTQTPSIVFYLYPNVSFVSASISPSAIYTDSVVWNLPPLSPFQFGQILVTVNLSSSIPIGTILNSYAQIFPIINDINPSCNNATWEVTVVGSFDPNDILVDRNIIYFTSFPNPPYLDYIIRFQNTGTDTAFTVKILNPLDTFKLDLNSIEFIASSHTVDLRFVYHERNLEFLFNNILLPDSNVNVIASQGFVRYRIKPKSNLVPGDTIRNFAAIYFDYNEPVITNTAITKIVLPSGIQTDLENSKSFIYPNPTSNELNFEISNTQGKNIAIDLYTLYGQKIKSLFQGNINTSEFKKRFEIGDLHQGMYLLEYRIDGISKSKKIIKL